MNIDHLKNVSEWTVEKINELPQIDLMILWRFAPSRHVVIQSPELFQALKTRLFDHFGGVDVGLSKLIGFAPIDWQ